jgi:hypothetical protein
VENTFGVELELELELELEFEFELESNTAIKLFKFTVINEFTYHHTSLTKNIKDVIVNEI